jgi:hypothetical protein
MIAPLFYRDPSSSVRFYYIPSDPTPERAPNGAPTLSLWMTNNDARLQLGVEWKLEPSQIEPLRRTIASRHPTLVASAIDLQPAPARVEAVHLLVRNATGQLESVARASSSGFPPYITLFAVTLNREQKTHAVSALHGRRGFLAIRYNIVVTREGGRTEAIERSADLADWFASGRGSDHIQVVPGTSLVPVPSGGGSTPPPTPTQPATLHIGLGERLQAAPLAFIRLEQGANHRFLRPPEFEPVQLPASAGPLRCMVQYTVGQAYTSELTPPAPTDPIGQEPLWLLGPGEIGLAEIVVSAPAWQAAGALEVRVQVRYLPAGSGSADERTVYLRGNKWQERWWVITRHSTLHGEVEITAKITAADGTVQTPPRYRQQTGEIIVA